MIGKFSDLEESESISVFIAVKKPLQKLLWGLYQQISSHFFFLKSISTGKYSKLLGVDLDNLFSYVK